MSKPTLRTALVLVIAPAIWGVGFVATKATLAGSGPLWANAIRFALATLVLLPIAARSLLRTSRRELRAGVLLGVFLLLAFTFQTVGMVTTSISHASFITGLYAVFVPIFGALLGKPQRAVQFVAAGLAVVGLLLLTGLHAGAGRVSVGDWFVLGCALVSAVHILLADRLATSVDPLALNFIQLATVAVVSLAGAFVLEGAPRLHWTQAVVVGQIYLAVFSSGVAFTLQFWAQRRIAPGTAAMIFLLEAPFGALAGLAVYGERLSLVQALGGLLMLAASYLAVATENAVIPPEELPLRETGL